MHRTPQRQPPDPQTPEDTPDEPVTPDPPPDELPGDPDPDRGPDPDAPRRPPLRVDRAVLRGAGALARQRTARPPHR